MLPCYRRTVFDGLNKGYHPDCSAYVKTSLDAGDRDVIPRSIQLIAGRTGQEYNQRKKRKGAFWEDRYHATAVETGHHLLRCLVYIDLNMVRARVVTHLRNGLLVNTTRSNHRAVSVLIAYEKLRELAGFENYEAFRESHRRWVKESLVNGETVRDRRWTRSVAVGSEYFVETIKTELGVKARGRHVRPVAGGYELREHAEAYMVHSDFENANIGLENSFPWVATSEISIC